MNRTCKHCQKPFEGRRKDATCCSAVCRKLFDKAEYLRTRGTRGALSTAAIGAIGELRVSADLVSRGWHVFRAVGASGPADLAVYKDGHLFLIEVTTGQRTKGGRLNYPPHEKNCSVYDVIAVIEFDGAITYVPDIINGLQELAA